MKKKIVLAVASFAGILCALAQTVLNPVPVDWRYYFAWQDPNPPGMVSSWLVSATNFSSSTIVRQVTVKTTNVDVVTLLLGAPAGIYGLYTTAVSTLGDVSDQATNFCVTWPGGDGKIHGGINHHVGK